MLNCVCVITVMGGEMGSLDHIRMRNCICVMGGEIGSLDHIRMRNCVCVMGGEMGILSTISGCLILRDTVLTVRRL